MHTSPTRLKQSPDDDLESPRTAENVRRRSKLAWAFGIVALILGATFVLESTPPDDTAPPDDTPLPADADPVDPADPPDAGAPVEGTVVTTGADGTVCGDMVTPPPQHAELDTGPGRAP